MSGRWAAWWEEWSSYAPSDFLLFSARTYWRLFELHNAQWWPLQPLLLALAVAAIAWWWRRGSARPAFALLGAAWLFVAWAFHAQRYAGINWAAGWLAAAFALQGALLLGLAWRMAPAPRHADRAPRSGAALPAAALLAFALFGHPLLGLALGRPAAQAEWFGLAPDPTALATLGALLLATPRPARAPPGAAPSAPPGAPPRALRRAAWVVPLAWCALSGATLWVMGARGAALLPLAGAAAVAAALGTRRRAERTR